MDFLHYTTNWVRGEIFEATLFFFFWLLIVISGLLFWKFGDTLNSKALVVPLLVVGLFFFWAAISGVISNDKRLMEYTEAYQQDVWAFVKSEKKRVEDFQYLYKMTVIIASISFILAISAFIFTENRTLRAIGIALVIFGITGLIIDYFSKERADIYYAEIIENIQRK